MIYDHIHPHFALFLSSYPLQHILLPTSHLLIFFFIVYTPLITVSALYMCMDVGPSSGTWGSPNSGMSSVPRGLVIIFAISTRVLASSLLCISRAGDFSCFKFISLITMSCLEDSISLHSFSFSSSYILSASSSFKKVLKPWAGWVGAGRDVLCRAEHSNLLFLSTVTIHPS